MPLPTPLPRRKEEAGTKKKEASPIQFPVAAVATVTTVNSVRHRQAPASTDLIDLLSFVGGAGRWGAGGPSAWPGLEGEGEARGPFARIKSQVIMWF